MCGDVSQGVFEGTACVAFGVGATTGAGLVDQIEVDVLRVAAGLEEATDPAPLAARGAGVDTGGGRASWEASVVHVGVVELRFPGSASEGRVEDVDPDPAALEVLEAGKASEVLARG